MYGQCTFKLVVNDIAVHFEKTITYTDPWASMDPDLEIPRILVAFTICIRWYVICKLGLYRIPIWPDIRPNSKYRIFFFLNKEMLVFNKTDQHFWSLFHSYFMLREKVLKKSFLIRGSHHLFNSLTGYPVM